MADSCWYELWLCVGADLSGSPTLMSMAPHLSLTEQDDAMIAWGSGNTTTEIFDMVARERARSGVKMPNITTLRTYLRGRPHRCGKVETHDRKRSLSRCNVLAMNAARVKFIKATEGTRQATWDLVRAKARAPRAHRTTVARAFNREGMDVKLRRCREKPQRKAEHEKERMDSCGNMRRWPLKRFLEDFDLIIDKCFAVPTTPAARVHKKKQKMVNQLRTRAEGLQKNFTKPKAKAHRRNLGGSVTLCAGISNCRIVLWEYVRAWNGQVAADMHKGPIMKVLAKHRGVKPSYLIAEDNDPTGYKSGKAETEKRRLGLRAIDWPRYSPDLMPLDFTLWEDIEGRLELGAPKGKESVAAFKKRLRRVALGTPAATVHAAVATMRKRANMIWEAKGKDIARD